MRLHKIARAVTHASRCRKGYATSILVDIVVLYPVSATASDIVYNIQPDPPKKWNTKLVATSDVSTPAMLPGRASSTRRPRPISESRPLSARGARPPTKGGAIVVPPKGPGGGTKAAIQMYAAEIRGPAGVQLSLSCPRQCHEDFEASSLRGGDRFWHGWRTDGGGWATGAQSATHGFDGHFPDG